MSRSQSQRNKSPQREDQRLGADLPGDTLAGRLQQKLFTFYVLLALLVAGGQFTLEYGQVAQRQNADLDAMQASLLPAMTEALARGNVDAVNAIMSSIKSMPLVVGAKIEDSKDKVLRAFGTVQDGEGRSMLGHPDASLTLIETKPGMFDAPTAHQASIAVAGRPIGSWTIYGNEANVWRAARHSLINIGLALGLTAILMWFLLGAVIRRVLSQPLTQVGDFINSINIGNIGQQMLVLRDPGENELHKLAGNLNHLTDAIKTAMDEKSSLFNKIKDTNQALETELTQCKLELDKVAFTDSLTGLVNRRKLDVVVENEADRVRRYGGELSIIIVDIDLLKATNDGYGNKVGDAVLATVADILFKGCRNVDTVGRWAGAKFLIICPHTGLAGGAVLAELLRVRISNHMFPEVGRKTCSFGVAALTDKEPLERFLARAEAAVQRAKDFGRNRYELDPPS